MPGASQMSNFPSGFSAGLILRGVPLVQTHQGDVYHVNNSSVVGNGRVAGADSGNGSYNRPFGSLLYAMSRAKANNGDIIFVGRGHAETISTAAILTLALAGIAVIGLGYGSMRPTFTFTAAAANIPITAKDVSLQNLLFVANFADVASMFTATGTATPTDFTVENCEFRDTSAILNVLTLITGNATANSMDGLAFIGNRVSSLGTTAATTAIKIAAATDRVKITDNFGVSAVLNDTAAIAAFAATSPKNIEIARNKWTRPNTSSTGGSFFSGSGVAWTGHAYDNYFYQLDNTAGIWIPTGTGLSFSQNFSPITGAADRSALINPAAV